MKNISSLLVVLVLSITLVNCTQETIPLSEDTTNQLNVNTDYSSSKILINNQKYVPTVISVLDQPTTNIARIKRTFFISKDQKESFSIQFNYAKADTINGTYPTKVSSTSNYAYLTYFKNKFPFDAISGEVKITEFANKVYRIEFLDVVVENPNYKEPSTIPDPDPTDETTNEGENGTDNTTETEPNIPSTETAETTGTRLKINYVVAEETPETTTEETPGLDPEIQAIIDDPTKRIIQGSFQATFIMKSRAQEGAN